MVFKAWLQKKREQVLEMRRIQQAKQIEDTSSRVSKTSLKNKFIQIWKLNLFTEGSLDIRLTAYERSRKVVQELPLPKMQHADDFPSRF